MRRVLFAAAFVLSNWIPLSGQQTATLPDRGIKYYRDSEEYAVLARQVYRAATAAATRGAGAAAARPWAVVLDVDETTLDTSNYTLERQTRGLFWEATSFAAWVERREAPAVVGVVDFVSAIKKAGGHVAFISNRDQRLADATRDNLRKVGVWSEDDRLCMRASPEDTKAVRRREVLSGRGDCSWGKPMRIAVFVGDQVGDFPDASEKIPGTGTDSAFGRTCFMVPNPTYGDWLMAVTRRRD